MHSCYIAFRNCARTHTRARYDFHSDVPMHTTPRRDGMALWQPPTGGLEAGSSQGYGLISVYLPRVDIKSFIFQAAACFVVFFFPVAVQQTKPSWVTAQDCSMQSWLVCPIAWFIACQSRSVFLFSVFAVCARTTDWNKCSVGCSKAMIDPNGVTMAIRSQTPASASDGVLHYVAIF